MTFILFSSGVFCSCCDLLCDLYKVPPRPKFQVVVRSKEVCGCEREIALYHIVRFLACAVYLSCNCDKVSS